MTSMESLSEELSPSEREWLAAFVVPPPSRRMEERVVSGLRDRPRPRPRPRWLAVGGLGLAVAVAALVILGPASVERATRSTAQERAATGAEEDGGGPFTPVPSASRPTSEWRLTGPARAFYQVGLDPNEVRNGNATRFLRSQEAHTGYGSWTRDLDASAYRGKRVRFSALVHTVAVDSWAGLWMKVGASGETMAFDNMKSRPIEGTTEWRSYEVVLDVADEAINLSYGLLLSGTGSVWFENAVIEEVPASVPSTNIAHNGWFEGDSHKDYFEAGVDAHRRRNGEPTHVLRSRGNAKGQQGTWMRRVSALPYRGRTVRFAAFVRTEDVETRAGLWMRIDAVDEESGKVAMLALENANSQPLQGTTEWTRREASLDVSATATHILYGVSLRDNGSIWIHDPALQALEDEGKGPASVDSPLGD